jgi:hypothetical protein
VGSTLAATSAMSGDEEPTPAARRAKRTGDHESPDVVSRVDGWLEVVTLALMCGILVLLGYVVW